jgi:diguanylate cyclase (GGDEF)-like protein
VTVAVHTAGRVVVVEEPDVLDDGRPADVPPAVEDGSEHDMVAAANTSTPTSAARTQPIEVSIPANLMGHGPSTLSTVTSIPGSRCRWLTGLLNRHGIERCLADALAEDPVEVLVAFIDLDGFKAVNDGHGHDAGDDVLRQMGARLRDAVRPRDDVARYGGDEFVIVCRQASVGAELAVTERVERILVEPIRFTGGWWQPEASIGMARATIDDDTSSLLRRADHSMYDVKRSHHAERLSG